MAIAFDNIKENGDSTTSGTNISYTATGSNIALFVGYIYDGGASVSAITWNGVGLTKVNSQPWPSAPDGQEFWFLGSAASGTHNIVLTFSSGFVDQLVIASYTGAAATLDGKNSANTNNANDPVSINTTADNCWMVGYFASGNHAYSSAGAGTTRRGSTNTYGVLGDTNGAIHPAGATTISVNWTNSSSNSAANAASISPATAPAANGNFLAFM